jgi:hypothetical protein
VFHRIVGGGFKSNYVEESTGEEYWIPGASAEAATACMAHPSRIEIDEDVREEYWTAIRNLPDERLTTCA